jgi:hypothetical protein
MKKAIFLFLIFPVCFSLRAQKELLLDTALTNNCNKWNLEIKYNNTSIGPYKTVLAVNGHLTHRSTSIEHDCFFTNYLLNNRSRPQSYTLLYNNTDSIFIEMGITIRERLSTRNYAGELLATRASHVINNWNLNDHDAAGSIKIPGGTSTWDFMIKNYGNPKNMYNLATMLTDGRDSISIKTADRYRGERREESNLFINHDYIKGIVFYFENREVAALRIMGKKNALISKGISESMQQAIASFMIVFLNTINE